MVQLLNSASTDRAMNAPKWLYIAILHLLIQQSIAIPNRIYGEVSDDDVVIDNLEDILQNREWNSNSRLRANNYHYPANKQIPFAVPPTDPRYHMTSEVLRQAAAASEDLHQYQQQHPLDLLNLENRKNLLEEVARRQRERYAAMEAAKPQYELYGPSETDVAGYHHQPHHLEVEEKSPKVTNSQPETVSYLQHSQHNAELPHFFMKQPSGNNNSVLLPDFYFVALVSGCTAAAVCAVVGAGICYFRLHKSKRDAAEAEYPAYGVTGPNKDLSPGAADRKLAQSAHMFHYQHQKQQMIALEKSSGDERHCSTSDVDSEEEGDDLDYTVYECPGLAPTGDLEVKNPLFSDDPTPATPVAHPNGTNNAKENHDDKDDE